MQQEVRSISRFGQEERRMGRRETAGRASTEQQAWSTAFLCAAGGGHEAEFFSGCIRDIRTRCFSEKACRLRWKG